MRQVGSLKFKQKEAGRIPMQQDFLRNNTLPRPAWARRHGRLWALLQALGLFLIAALLAVQLKNGSTYATGSWDDYSQALVFGRMLQMQQDQSAPGGFMGVYTEEWGDGQNRYLYRDNTPVSPEDFHSYTHQTGLQGWALGVLNKVYSVVQDDGVARETMLYTTNAILYYFATLLVCAALYRAVGALPALAWLAAVCLAPGLQTGMKDLYWCLWIWMLPLLAGIALCAATLRRGKTPVWAAVLLGAACMVRCMCGFEFISTYLILCETPLVWCWAKSLASGRPARPWVVRMVAAGASALTGVAAALGIWLCQGVLYYGNWKDSLENILGAAGSRMSVSDNTVREGVTVLGVLAKYLVQDVTPALTAAGVSLTLGQILAVTLAASVLSTAVLLMLRRRDTLAALAPMLCVWALSVAAPCSWLVLSKAHSDIHSHLIPVLFQFSAVPASAALLAALIVAWVRVARRPRRA